MAALVKLVQHGVDQHKGGYNPFGVHRFLLGSDSGVVLRILPEESMGVN